MLTDLRYRVASLFRRRQADADLDDELRFHLDHQTASYVRQGVNPDEARRLALIDLGGLAQAKDNTRDSWGVRLVESLAHDVWFAARTLRKTPGFTLTALLTLTIGISLNTSVATMCLTMMYRPWPVPVAGEVVVVDIVHSHDRLNDVRAADYERLARNATLSTVVATGCGMEGLLRDCRFEIDGGPPALGHFVSGNYFSALEIPLERGRGLTEADDRPEAPAPVVVISHEAWMRRFGGAPDILGRTIDLDGVPFSIVGVTAPSFNGTSLLPRDLWVSLASARTLRPSRDAMISGLELAARIRPGTSRQQARAEFDALLASADPSGVTSVRDTSLFSRPNSRNEAKTFFAVAFAAVLLVLLVACANVGNLLLARTAARGREIALRVAIGASRGRVIRQLLTESLVLAGLASAIGLWVARIVPELIFNAALRSAGGATGPGIAAGPDWRVVAFDILLTTVTCVAFGLAPAVQASRIDVLPELNGRGRGFARTSLRSWLLGLQVAISVTLLGASGLLARGLERASTIDRGFRPDGVSMISFELPASVSIAQRQTFEAAIIEGSRAIVDHPDVAIATAAPFQSLVARVHLTDAQAGKASWVPMTEVSSHYFAVLGIPLLSGRLLSPADAPQHRLVVNDAFVRRVMQGRSPLGVVLYDAGESARSRIPHEVVGVVGTIDQGEGAEPAAYEILGARSEWLWRQSGHDQRPPYVLFRTRGAASTTPIQNAAKQFEPRVRLVQMPLADVIAARFSNDRVPVWMAGSVGVLTLLLATIGVCGAFAYAVQQQTREIGIRMAIGARTGDVVRSMLRGSTSALVVGLGVGFAGAAVAGELFRDSLYGLNPLDPLSYVEVAIIVAVSAVAALALPAWRASRVNPITVLKAE